jgi:hypothetical protein
MPIVIYYNGWLKIDTGVRAIQTFAGAPFRGPCESFNMQSPPNVIRSGVSKLCTFLLLPQPAWLLLCASALVGMALVSTTLTWGFIAGNSSHWIFPYGIVGDGNNDMADYLVGYLYQMRAPWSVLLLFTANLGAPEGTNVFWLDVVPWLSLTGKAYFTSPASR